MSARQAAVQALLQIEQAGGYSNIVLEERLSHTALSAADRGLLTRLVYGVVERRLTLDYCLNRVSSVPVKQMEPAVREILRVGAYQLLYMTRIPAYAVVSEAAEQAPPRLRGFVNGVLRGVQRQGAALIEALPDTDKGLEQRYSCPRVWIRCWRDAYGEVMTHRLLAMLNEAPPAYIRICTQKITPAAFTARLDQAGIAYTAIPGLPAALQLDSSQALLSLPEETQEFYYFQDAASQWSCRALGARPGEQVADVCAAPGGKTFTVAQDMQNTGRIVAGDIYPQKCGTLRRRAAALGLSSVEVVQRDAAADPPAEWLARFDRVLCDAPCSGLGVIRRKPEIRYKQPEDFVGLPALQLQILRQAAKLVRPGGILQYSTCTLRPEENEQVAAAFLAAEAGFAPRPLPLPECFAAADLPLSHQITLLPPVHGTDGFYIAGFVKKQNEVTA